MLYAAPQLRLLILLVLTLLAGLGVREWREGFPDAAERFERFDREEPLSPEPPAPWLVPPAPAIAPSSPAPRPPTVAAATAVAAPPPTLVDINRADLAQLARLPGVGPGLAQRIIEERERRGRFESPEELRHVLGMGPKKLAAIRPFIAVRD